MKKGIIIIGALLVQLSCYGQALQFFAEDLTFRLSPEVFEVEGDYYFRNTTDKPTRQMLLYPFPDEAAYGTISCISIMQGSDSILFKRTAGGVLFTVTAAARQEVAYRIGYDQQLTADSACYIITTTQRWKQPFEWATYQLRMPDNLTLLNISILPDSIGHTSTEEIYYWSRRNFLPQTDFLIRYGWR
jgi:hypothetical protein